MSDSLDTSTPRSTVNGLRKRLNEIQWQLNLKAAKFFDYQHIFGKVSQNVYSQFQARAKEGLKETARAYDRVITKLQKNLKTINTKFLTSNVTDNDIEILTHVSRYFDYLETGDESKLSDPENSEVPDSKQALESAGVSFDQAKIEANGTKKEVSLSLSSVEDMNDEYYDKYKDILENDNEKKGTSYYETLLSIDQELLELGNITDPYAKNSSSLTVADRINEYELGKYHRVVTMGQVINYMDKGFEFEGFKLSPEERNSLRRLSCMHETYKNDLITLAIWFEDQLLKGVEFSDARFEVFLQAANYLFNKTDKIDFAALENENSEITDLRKKLNGDIETGQLMSTSAIKVKRSDYKKNVPVQDTIDTQKVVITRTKDSMRLTKGSRPLEKGTNAECVEKVSKEDLEGLLGATAKKYDSLARHFIKGDPRNTCLKIAIPVVPVLIAGTLGGIIYSAVTNQNEVEPEVEPSDNQLNSIKENGQNIYTEVYNWINSHDTADWSSKIGGAKALEDFSKYTDDDATNDKLSTLKDKVAELKEATTEGDANTLLGEIKSLDTGIREDVNAIINSIGTYKNATFKGEDIQGVDFTGWRSVLEGGKAQAVNILYDETTGDASVQVVFGDGRNGEYFTKGVVKDVSEFYEDKEIDKDDISAILKKGLESENDAVGAVQIYKPYGAAPGLQLFISGMQDVFSGSSETLHYVAFSEETGKLIAQGSKEYRISQSIQDIEQIKDIQSRIIESILDDISQQTEK